MQEFEDNVKKLKSLYKDIDVDMIQMDGVLKDDFEDESKDLDESSLVNESIILNKERQQSVLEEFKDKLSIKNEFSDEVNDNEIKEDKEDNIQDISEEDLDSEITNSNSLEAVESINETWITLDEFLNFSGFESNKVQELIKDGIIKNKEEKNVIYIDAGSGTSALVKKIKGHLVSLNTESNTIDSVFVEKTIATILGLHDKVVGAKDEAISAYKGENSFLKEALISMQEIYEDDKKMIEVLREQLQKNSEELEFVKRKYKLMWGKVTNSTK